MNFLKLFLLPVVLMFSNNIHAEDITYGDKYEKMIDKSIKYIECFVQVINELEALRDRLSLWMRSLSHEVIDSNRDSNDYKESIKIIMSHIENLNNSLIKLSSQDLEGIDTSNKEIDKILNNESEKNGRYDVIIAKVAKLYGHTFRMIAKFYSVLDRLEKHVEDVSHDYRNINSSYQQKQQNEKNIQFDINKLSKEVDSLIKITNNEIEEYSKIMDNRSKSDNNTKLEKNNDEKEEKNSNTKEQKSKETEEKTNSDKDQSKKEVQDNKSEEKESKKVDTKSDDKKEEETEKKK